MGMDGTAGNAAKASTAAAGMEKADVVIAGGGLGGLSLALALKEGLGRDAAITVYDPGFGKPLTGDKRCSAIAAGARRLLTVLGVWQQVGEAAQPMTIMTVTDSRTRDTARPVFLTFDGDVEPGEPFAYMVPNAILQQALTDAAIRAGLDMRTAPVSGFVTDRSGVTVTGGDGATVRASLLVACDGARSRLRSLAGITCTEWEYGQSAMTFTVEHERPHHGEAIEHFLPAGPFATLPLPGNRASIVWTEKTEDARRLADLPDYRFQEELEQRFGHKLGWVKVEGKPQVYPLGFAMARTFIGERFALVGDAAHRIHPIAGQGLNMGLRDVAALAEAMTDAARVGLDFASPQVLERYQRWRRFDTFAMGMASDTLNKLFSNQSDALRIVRDIGLGVVDRLPRLKQFFIRDAAGLGGTVPKLLRGEAL
ncbi:2-octaprenyl-6-methoxyphenyl hydroxylase [Azorhizobium oxalatiphilum]|uniref:2-octaprenyl-6-methoxyphenyl hydroxylase n=2 Tax=Azorhizobium oxalatiphilum TaxID=980631 RepID=A0A917CL48_9HYPH|nr:2-octaprenyl-6-methoxyphenyl hydroxylase [Azorhizobium oxalatiphilum]